MNTQIIKYTQTVQEILGKSAPKSEPWLHCVISSDKDVLIYVWDTRKVIYESKLTSKQFAELTTKNLAYPQDNRKRLVGTNKKFEYFNAK
jgi:hypothetical protein